MLIDYDVELAAYTVTQEQWEALMGNNPSSFSRFRRDKKVSENEKGPSLDGLSDADLKRFPVESVSWDDVQQFLEKLNERQKGQGWTYRLPREVEWEYGCRNAATSKADCMFDFYAPGPTNTLTLAQANIREGSKDGPPPLGRPTKVGSYPPNQLGLYDMHGNVYQWCDDARNREKGDTYRIARGGSWRQAAEYGTAAIRRYFDPSTRDDQLGFRLARVVAGKEAPGAAVTPKVGGRTRKRSSARAAAGLAKTSAVHALMVGCRSNVGWAESARPTARMRSGGPRGLGPPYTRAAMNH